MPAKFAPSSVARIASEPGPKPVFAMIKDVITQKMRMIPPIDVDLKNCLKDRRLISCAIAVKLVTNAGISIPK